MTTLADLTPGQAALVAEVLGEDSISVRIMEMGIIDGEEVVLIGRAPMGDPIEVEVRGYRLSLRSAEARRVSVQVQ